jgi:hypothetical protein
MHDTCKYIQDTYKYIHIHSNTYTPNARVMYTIILGIFSVDMAYMKIRTNTCIYVQIHTHTFRYIHIHSNLNTCNRSMQGYAAHSGRATGSWPGTARGQGTSMQCTQFQAALLSATVRPGFKLGSTCQWRTWTWRASQSASHHDRQHWVWVMGTQWRRRGRWY